MANEVYYFEGIDDLLLAPMTTLDNIEIMPKYGEITRLPIITKVAIKGNGSTKEKWASSKMFRRVSKDTKHEIGLDHVGFPVDLLDSLKGLAAVKGVTFSKTAAYEYPYWALGFIGRIEGGGRKAVWYPKVQLSNVIDESYQTAEEEQDIVDVTSNFVSTGLNFNEVLHSSFDSYRASAAGIDLTTFIKQPVFDEAQWQELIAAAGGLQSKGG